MCKLYLLGCGTPTPTPTRFGTSYVLKTNQDYLMFDCGPATTYKLVKAELFPTQINYLFFTHHHADHNVDYPCFMLCRWDQSIGKEAVLNIYGPPPTKSITEKLFGDDGVFHCDLEARINASVSQCAHKNRGGSLPRPKMRYNVYNIEPGQVTSGNEWGITAACVHHVEPWLNSLAYRVNINGRSITFAGDTGPCKALDELASGTDVLVVNCWDHQATMNDNGEAPGQTGTIDAAKAAKNSGAKKLILTHCGTNISSSKEKALSDIANIYKGQIIFAEELTTVDLW